MPNTRENASVTSEIAHVTEGVTVLPQSLTSGASREWDGSWLRTSATHPSPRSGGYPYTSFPPTFMATRPQYTRNRNGRIQKPPQRQSSVLGRLKSLFLNPFGAWVGSDLENEQGKRPRHSDVDYGADQDDDSVRRSKRKRLDNVQDESDQFFEQPTFHPVTNGYLDPPSDAFNRTSVNKPVQRASSLVIPQSTGRHQPQQNGHYSLSPQPTASLRTMRPILEETNQTSRRSDYVDATRVPLPLSRDASMESIGGPVRDSSKSPSRPKFRMRTSMTPQPTGQNFGPSRKERDRSEPPPLASLVTRPMFVKPPTGLSTVTEEPVRHSTVPLGAVAETYRTVSLNASHRFIPALLTTDQSAPTRQRSVLSLTRQLSDIDMEVPRKWSSPLKRIFDLYVNTSTAQRPLSAAEKALQELEMYKTPLLPSRLRGAPSIPDMFKQKPVHSLAVMHDDRDDMPRLGTSDKQSAKRRSAKGKPYSGSGGVKKLLERRKREEKEEKKKEKDSAIVTDAEEEQEARAAEKKKEELPKENEARAPERRGFTVVPSAGGRERSSLRVGRTRTNVYREAATSRSKRGFSAKYDEDEADDEVEEQQETPRLKPMFQPPPGFSFPTNVSSSESHFTIDSDTDMPIKVSPVKHDSSKAKEPPIAALPFSLSKSQTPYSTAPTPSETSKAPAQDTVVKDTTAPVVTSSNSASAPAPAPPTPLFAASVPPIAVIPPTPDAPAKAAESTTANASPSSIPNFFANSALVRDAPKLVTTPFVLPSSPSPAPASTTTAGSFFGGAQKPTDGAAPLPSLFGNKPTALGSAAPISDKEKVPEKAAEAEKPPVASLFGSAPTSNGFSFGAPTASAPASVTATTTALANPFSFGVPKPAEPTSTPPAAATPVSAFSFGGPSKPADAPAESAAKTPSLFGFGGPAQQPEAPKATTPSPFSFGAPKADAPKEAEVKPVASTPSPAPLFGAPAPSVPATAPTSEPPKSLFTFGAPAASTTAPSAPTIEAPKPLFGNASGSPFSFGQPSSSPAPEAPKSVFTFGASPSPAPPSATETKAPFTFGSTPSPAPPVTNSLFSGPSTTTAEAPKSTFTFGAPSTPVRPVTPPQQKDNEMSMDESPTRSTMDVNGKRPEMNLPTFSFSTPSSSPFGQPTTPVNNNPAPFSFGAPSSNPFGAKPSEPKPEEKPAATGFGSFGSSSGPGFSFGKPAETSRPSTSSGGFPFPQPSVPPINTTPSFSFGSSNSTTNAFGASSTPASPSTFNQPTNTFGFGSSNPTPASATAPSNPFAFGSSQPASPATGTAGLPNAPAANPFAFGTPSPATPTFGTQAPTLGGGPQFTLGAAPPQNTASSGGRQIKKLPSRRGGSKR